MKFFELKSYYIVTDIKEHKQIKQKLLDLINLMPNSSFKSISKTDWNLPKEHKREYLNYFYGMLSPYLNEMCKKLKYTAITRATKYENINMMQQTNIVISDPSYNFKNVKFVEKLKKTKKAK